jgi:LmbE family N-acetylglucosaminyl deacetylase
MQARRVASSSSPMATTIRGRSAGSKSAGASTLPRARAGARVGALLGVGAGERFFFGMPDLGLTASLMHTPAQLPDGLLEHIAHFRPTHLALPTLDDRHPDHSAVHIAARLALLSTPQMAPKLLIYAVHGKASLSDTQLELSPAQRSAKQNAILQHETQMRLSRKRFLGFAGDVERFRAATQSTQVRDDHPLRTAISGNGELQLRLLTDRLSGTAAGAHVLILIDLADGSRLRWRLPVGAARQQVEIIDSRDDRVVSCVQWQEESGTLHAALALFSESSSLLGYAKLVSARSGLVVFDRYGWQKIEIAPQN